MDRSVKDLKPNKWVDGSQIRHLLRAFPSASQLQSVDFSLVQLCMCIDTMPAIHPQCQSTTTEASAHARAEQ